MTTPLLEVRNLTKSYDEGRIEALRGVDLSITAGEFVAISGPSTHQPAEKSCSGVSR